MFICSECQNIPIIKINNNINIECSCGTKQCEQINKLKIKQINSSCIIDNKQSTLYCPFCNISLCQNCGTIHNILYKHSSLFSIISHNYCLRHYEEKILYYCDECKVNQCNECFKSEKVDCLLYDFNDCIDIYKAFISAIKDKNCIIGRKLFFLFIENYNINNIKNSFINFLHNKNINIDLDKYKFKFHKKQKDLILTKNKEISIEKIVGRKEFECKCLTSFKDGRIALAEYNKINNNIYILNPQNNLSFDIKIESAHNREITSLCLVDDDQLISCSIDGIIKLWYIETHTYRELGKIETLHSKVITFSPNNIVSYSHQDNKIIIWDYLSNFELINILINSSNITSILKLTQINYLISSSKDDTLRWWDLFTYNCEYTLNNIENTEYIYEIDNNKIIVGEKIEILIIDSITHELLETIRGNYQYLSSFILLNGVFLFCSNYSLNKITSNTFEHEIIFKDDSFMLITKNTNYTLVSYGNKKLTIWEFNFNIRNVIQNTNKKELITLRNLKLIYKTNQFSNAICLLPNGKIASCDINFIYIYNPNNNYEIDFIINSPRVQSLCVLNENKLIACSVKENINIWKIKEVNFINVSTIKGHKMKINKVIALNKIKFATCSIDATIKIWEINPLSCIQILKGHTSGVYSMIYLKKRKYLISCSSDDTVKWWNLQSNQCEYSMNIIVPTFCTEVLYEIDVNRIAVGQEGKILIINSFNYKIINEIVNYNFVDVISFCKVENELYFGNGKGDIFKLNLNSFKYYLVSFQMEKEKEKNNYLIYLKNGIFATSGWKLKIWKKD